MPPLHLPKPMFELFRKDPFPRKVLIAFAVLMGTTVLLVAAARLTGYNASQMPPSPTVLSRDLRFIEGADGVLLVQDAADGLTIATLPAGGEGFLRGVLRATSRGRMSAKVAHDTPYRLAQLADGRLTLKDLGTQRVIELNSFGPTNVASFAVFLKGVAPVLGATSPTTVGVAPGATPGGVAR
jgi:putative photosynthetic complex assembly protein